MAMPRISLRGERNRPAWLPDRPRRPPGRLRKAAVTAVAVIVFLPATLIFIYGLAPPPITPLMLIRMTEGEGITKHWVPLSLISPNVPDAVIASEDNRFCIHFGFDFEAIQDVMTEYEGGGGLRGASTISMQTAKNLFLWPSRSWVRKGIEAYLTVLVELLWPKQRIMEVYLNIIEWGHGIYGIDAASHAYFGKDASKLTRYQAALLAAILPNPREWSANPPGSYVAERAGVISARIPKLGELLDCVHAGAK
jgi:monofunctional biosynthetic peptidoglycan transglycosylase